MKIVPRALAVAVALAATSGVARAEDAPGDRVPAPAPPPDFRFSGYVQADWVIHRQSSQDEVNGATGQPLNEDRFVLRRGHVRVDWDKGGPVFGALEIDANTVNGPIVRPIAAEASVRWPPTRDEPPLFVATMGLLRTPFGFEVQELDNVRPFLERATVLRAFVPGEFDLGLRFKVQWRALDLALGLMNGAPIGASQFPGRDPSESKDMVGRLGVHSKVTDAVVAAGGVSAITGMGFHKGTPTTKDTLVWRDTNEDGVVQPTEIQVIPGSSATASENFKRYALGADAQLRWTLPLIGELALRAEIVWGKNIDRAILPADPVAAGRDLREFGWYAGATQEITRWGMVGVRYDRYNADQDANRQSGVAVVPSDATFSTLAVMGMLRYAPGRLVLEYDHNTNPLGRTTAGAPTTLKDDALTLRAQVSF